MKIVALAAALVLALFESAFASVNIDTFLSTRFSGIGPISLEVGKAPAFSPADLLSGLMRANGLTKVLCKSKAAPPTNDDQVIALLTECLSDTSLSDEDRAFVLTLRAAAYLNKGDATDAIADCNAAIKLNPRDDMAYRVRGWARLRLTSKDLDGAIADFSVALQIRPDAGTYVGRGECYFLKHNWGRAIGDYTQAIKLNPDFPHIYSVRAYAETNKGDFKAAVADFSEDIRRNPGVALTYSNRGNAYAQLSDCKSALADFDQALAMDAGLSVAVILKSEILSTCEDEKYRDGAQALILAHKALSMPIQNIFVTIGAHEALATADAETGNFDEAIQEAQTALAISQTAGWPEIVTRQEKILAVVRAHKPVRLPHDAPLVS